MNHTFNPTILREYDIRGVVGDTLTEADAYALGRTYAAKAHGEGAGTVEEVDVREAYVGRMLQDFAGGAFRIGWDAGNGAAGPILDMLVERLPGQHHVIFVEVDGTFPNHHPDPTVEANLADLKR